MPKSRAPIKYTLTFKEMTKCTVTQYVYHYVWVLIRKSPLNEGWPNERNAKDNLFMSEYHLNCIWKPENIQDFWCLWLIVIHAKV